MNGRVKCWALGWDDVWFDGVIGGMRKREMLCSELIFDFVVGDFEV